MKRVLLVALVSFLPVLSYAEVIKSTIEDQTSVEVTVYNSNMGLVKDVRSIDVPEGVGELQFMDVAASVNPVTVVVKSLNAPEQFSILEQNYEYDLMNSTKLLDKYVGKTVKIVDENEYQGTEKLLEAELLSNNSGQIYRIGGEIYLGHNGRVILPEIPENLIAKPTLTWVCKNGFTQPQQLEVSYLTANINWAADYIMTVDQDDVSAGLDGWVTVINNSGTEYRDAALKLVAGEVNRVQEDAAVDDRMYEAPVAQAKGMGFQEEAFFEYHIYDLQRPTTIKHNQTKQIRLLEAKGFKMVKEFILQGASYYFQGSYPDRQDVKVGVFLKFKNEEKNKLGMPLPAGIVRLYKADRQGKLQFIGEDRIDHTPKDEEVTLNIGNAFDIAAQRKQMDYQVIGSYAVETEWEIVVRNHKEEDVVVTVVEPVSGEWTVLNSTHPYEKLDARNIRFKIPVSKDESATLKYRVRVSNR